MNNLHSSRRSTASVGALALGALALLAVSLQTGCLTETDSAPADFSCPTEDNWPIVSQTLERRCGTLDCHGDPGRPFRLFGRNGARLSDNDVVGSTDGTTPAELDQNRLSACGLEPEKMTAVVEENADIETLTLVRKPLLIEAHKGGMVWLEDSPGFVCLASWLQSNVDVEACEAEIVQP